jgi:polysaccharide export outer membrane protein
MKILSNWWERGFSLLGVCAVALVLTGCHSTPKDEPVFSSDPVAATSGAAASAPAASGQSAAPAGVPLNPGAVNRFRQGDMVTVTFSGLELAMALAPHEERIKEDGTITLPMIGSVLAKGKTAGELQKEIQERYVPKYYQRLVVTVKFLDSFYYVGGEVKVPNRQPWVGELTVTQAIQSAGDFTDFANRKKVLLVRADNTKITVNCVKALGNPSLDPKVFPGDKITVPRRWW